MRRTLLHSKIHRATVTGSDLNYIGSITLDPELMEAANILENERIWVLDVDNGARFDTYVIPGVRGDGEVQLNGAAARLVHTGDKVILVTYAEFEANELEEHVPTVVHVASDNSIVAVSRETGVLEV